MKRLIAASGVLAFVVPAAAAAKPPSPRQFGVYRYLYRHARHHFGLQTVGCELRYTCRGKVTAARVEHSDGVLLRMMAPPPPPPPPPVAHVAYTPTAYTQPAASTPVASAPAPSYSSGGYTIPANIVQCESGGNYSAVNSSSGAGGAYQILPSTWAAYGGSGLPQNASPAEQGAIAAKIWAKQGPSAWVC